MSLSRSELIVMHAQTEAQRKAAEYRYAIAHRDYAALRKIESGLAELIRLTPAVTTPTAKRSAPERDLP